MKYYIQLCLGLTCSLIAFSGSGQVAVDASNSTCDLAKVYSRAIDDYIQLVNREYKLTFDTLYFGKHVYGQADDFPDIELPPTIDKIYIKLISPEQGEKAMKVRNTMVYINLIGWVNADTAEFIFVTFFNGFAHQFDCFVNYRYNNSRKVYEVERSWFENYLFKAK